MKARGWDSGDQADDEVAGVEEDGAGAVLPDVFESELKLAVGAELQAVLSELLSLIALILALGVYRQNPS